MPRLLRFCVLLLALLFQLGLGTAAASEQTEGDASARSAAPAKTDAEGVGDESSEGPSCDDAADEDACPISLAVWPFSPGTFTGAAGLESGSLSADTPFKPPRSSLD